MGDFKDDALSYLNDLGNNLGRKFGLDDNGYVDIQKATHMDIQRLNIPKESKDQLDAFIDDIPEKIERYISQDEEIKKGKNPFLERAISVYDIIKEKNSQSNKYRKEYFAIQAFTLGTILTFAGTVHPLAKYILGPIFVKVGYSNSEILKKVFSERDIERYTSVKLEDAFKK